MGTSWTCSHLVRGTGGLGIPELVAGISKGDSPVGDLWSLMLTLGVCISLELYCLIQRLYSWHKKRYICPALVSLEFLLGHIPQVRLVSLNSFIPCLLSLEAHVSW